MSRSSSVAADTASFGEKTKADMRRRVVGDEYGESVSLSTCKSSSKTHAATGSTEGTSLCSHTLSFLHRSCHNNQQTFTPSSGTARLCWKIFYSKSHTQWLAAFIMIGCVKYNAMILGMSVMHNLIWQIPARQKKKLLFFNLYLCCNSHSVGKNVHQSQMAWVKTAIPFIFFAEPPTFCLAPLLLFSGVSCCCCLLQINTKEEEVAATLWKEINDD